MYNNFVYSFLLLEDVMKDYIKNHKKTIILIFIYALLVVLAIKVKDIFIPNEGLETYGTRLNEIDKYPIADEVYDKLEEELKKNENVTNVEKRVQGKIINYYITVADKVSIADAKKIGDSVLTGFDDKTKSYYSFQIWMLKENKELNNFPIVGMKHPNSEKIVWTQDREITKVEAEGENNED